MTAGKNLSIETLRGIAILLVVSGHVIGSAPDGGMKIDFPHPLRYLYLWIDYIQMPLFTAIAGWVYALKPAALPGGFVVFARKKAMRLLVPMIVVGTLYFVIQYLVPGTNNKGDITRMWRIYFFPYTIYWYLPSLFLIFMIQWCIDRYKKMESLRQWAVWCERPRSDARVAQSFQFQGGVGATALFFCRCGRLPVCAGVSWCRLPCPFVFVGSGVLGCGIDTGGVVCFGGSGGRSA